MNRLLLAGLLAGLSAGCAPCMMRSPRMYPSAYSCPPCQTQVITSLPDDCALSGSPISSAPAMESAAPSASAPSSFASPVDDRINALEDDVNALKGDVGAVRQQNGQIDRKLDTLIREIAPLK